MVSAHIWLHPYSKKTSGQEGGQLVRYLQREGEFAPVHYVERTGTHAKEYNDYVTGGMQNLPGWAQHDPHVFFTQARTYESLRAYYAFQVEFSLPQELNAAQHLHLTHDLMEAVIPDLPALWVKHEKRLSNGELHPHIHILFSARKQDEFTRDGAQTFKRWDRKYPVRGGCKKDLLWSRSQAPEQLRMAFTDITNYHLETAGVAARVDHRSLQRRALHRQAIGRGGETPDAATLAQEQRQAAAAWEHRKAYKGLGDIRTIPREEMVLLVRQWTREYAPGTQLPRATPAQVCAYHATQEAKLTTAIEHLEHVVDILGKKQRGEPVPMRDLIAVLAEDRTHQDGIQHGRTRLHLFDEDHAYGRHESRGPGF